MPNRERDFETLQSSNASKVIPIPDFLGHCFTPVPALAEVGKRLSTDLLLAQGGWFAVDGGTAAQVYTGVAEPETDLDIHILPGDAEQYARISTAMQTIAGFSWQLAITPDPTSSAYGDASGAWGRGHYQNGAGLVQIDVVAGAGVLSPDSNERMPIFSLTVHPETGMPCFVSGPQPLIYFPTVTAAFNGAHFLMASPEAVFYKTLKSIEAMHRALAGNGLTENQRFRVEEKLARLAVRAGRMRGVVGL